MQLRGVFSLCGPAPSSRTCQNCGLTTRQDDKTTTLNQCIKFYHSAAVAAAVVVRRVEEEVLAGEEGLVLPVRGLRHQLASPGVGACPPSPPSTSASVFAGKMF